MDKSAESSTRPYRHDGKMRSSACLPALTRLGRARRRDKPAFTLVELLVTIAIIAILAGLILPALAKARGRAQTIISLSNLRQLTIAWMIYSDENDGRLPYNLGGDPGRNTFAPKTNANWVNNIMSWNVDADITNAALITEASLGIYANKNTRIYRCPADRALSDEQRQAGFTERSRSYSMNAMLGNAGKLTKYGINQNNPDYLQFFTYSSIPHPENIFVFLEEHPDSINDGYFLNIPDDLEWVDLPASDHNGAGVFSFADGHVELHKWLNPETVRPSKPDAGLLPSVISPKARADFDWVAERTSIER